MLDRFHSKLHRYNHYTDYVPGYADSASDPIAAPGDPFRGSFHIQGALSATSVGTVSSVFFGGSPNTGRLTISTLTAPRTYGLPNNSGIVVLDSTVSSYVSSISAGTTNNFISTVTVWVDSISGNDLTGLRERADKPFKTLTIAQSVATAGDLIFVRNGSYTDVALGKNGVNWYFDKGATLVGSSPTQALFTYSTMSYNVYGSLIVTITGNIDPTAGIPLVADFTGSNGTSDLLFEFKSINITNSASIANNPSTCVFRGTYGAKNVLIRGDSIVTQKISVFGGVKNLTAGTQYLKADFAGQVIGQNIFYNSGQRLSTYLTANLLSASDYVYNDGTAADAADAIFIEAKQLYGSVLKDTTTGPLYIEAVNFTVTPRSTMIWSASASGDVTVRADSLTSNIKFDSGTNTYFGLNKYTASDNLSSGYNYAIGYSSNLTFDAKVVSLTYTASSYSLFNATGNSSVLNTKLGDVTNVSLKGAKLVNVDGYSATKVFVKADRLINGADIKVYGTNTKSKFEIGQSPNTYIDLKALSASTDSIFFIDGLYKTLSASNIRVEAVSGQAGTKLYLNGGTTLETVGTYNLNLSAFVGSPLETYLLGWVETNKTPLDVTANFNINCGQFESTSAVAVPVF